MVKSSRKIASEDLENAARQARLFWRREATIKKEFKIEEFVENPEKLASFLRNESDRFKNSIEFLMKKEGGHIDPTLILKDLDWPISAVQKLIKQLEESST